MAKDRRLVYSTDPAFQGPCPRCGKRRDRCRCDEEEAPPAPEGPVKVACERRKRGKQVTVVQNLPGAKRDLAELARTLRTLCGTGGTVKAGAIELQGDHREKVTAHLREAGHQVR